ncbi:MAG: class II aldolase/adducin family protein [Candidatus Cloacimonetes bacterium]|nr:class II aldolase/adducin family protein [Candidatus Cloacimonadota bacterium]
MGNEYKGTKFRTNLKEAVIESPLAAELKYWSAVLARNNCAPAIPGGYGGNLSCREGNSFLITASGANLANLGNDQIVRVVNFDLNRLEVDAEGWCLPSSETLLHGAVYKARPEIKAVFHGHYPAFEENFMRLGLKITARAAEYGSIDLVKDVLEILGDESIVLLRKHGFISLGETADEAGNNILDMCRAR